MLLRSMSVAMSREALVDGAVDDFGDRFAASLNCLLRSPKAEVFRIFARLVTARSPLVRPNFENDDFFILFSPFKNLAKACQQLAQCGA